MDTVTAWCHQPGCTNYLTAENRDDLWNRQVDSGWLWVNGQSVCHRHMLRRCLRDGCMSARQAAPQARYCSERCQVRQWRINNARKASA